MLGHPINSCDTQYNDKKQHTFSDFGYISTKLIFTHQTTVFNVTSVSALQHTGYICCYSVVYASNKVCQEFYTELSYFMKAAKFQLCW
jgi:hypothetical protein